MPSVSKRRSRAWLGLVLGSLLAGWAATAQAFFSLGLIPGIYVPQTYYKFGAVYTRAIVLSPNGKPIWVEYGSDGKEAREIGEATGPLEQAQVMSGDVYRAYLQRLKDARERYPNGEVMTAATYRGTSFKTVDGKAIDKPSLSPSSLTVLVRGEKERFSTKGDELLLLQMPIDSNVTPSSSSKALLLSKEGQILHQGTNSIGFRAGFFGKDGKVDDKSTRDRDAKIYGPMPGVGVTLGGHIRGGYAQTDDEGKYRMKYFLPACPGFFFEYTTPAYLELYYKRFNPRGSSNMPYYLTRPDYDFCNGLGVWSLEAAAIVAAIATPVKQAMDFPIDLMVLDGSAQFGGGVTLGEKTVYSDKTGKRDNYLQEKYDFDGDGKPDWVVPGKKVTKTVDGEPKEVFVKTSLEEAELQGIYLSSRFDSVPANTEETAPDFTRLIDVAPDMEDRGLLESISKDDLKDTDIYVFRESNGQLVAERRGLHEDELYKNYSGVDEKTGSFRYTIQLRGSKENRYALSGRNDEAAFSKWQSAGGFKEEFQKRAANHLKAGETVRIIAINRPTGYIGSVKVQLQSAVASGNLLNFADQRIELAPPNLKVWAERKNKIEKGMTKGELKKQLIGNEGAALGNDVSIAIYTDWRDADGAALPEELADYGYTGRLAKIVAANQLAPVGANSLSQFKIKPGQQVQVIQLPEKVLAKQHLYLQVTGQPQNRNPDFSSKGAANGILKYRPTRYVPVRVPLFDEESSELARQAYRKADKERPELKLKAPQPIYTWKYRPELQFSLYDLNVKAIRREAIAGQTELLGMDTPSISPSDRKLSIIFDFIKSEFSELGLWSGEKKFIFDLGGREVAVNFGKSGEVSFDDLSFISGLDVDDYLSLRLLSNNDAGNILWEWSVNSTLDLYPGSYTVSAASSEKELVGIAFLTEKEMDEGKSLKFQWVASNGGKFDAAVTKSSSGLASNKLRTSHKAGDRYDVTLRVIESDYPNIEVGSERKFGPYVVEPAEPARIEITTSKQRVLASGVDTVRVTAKIWDEYGNPVRDGTNVNWLVGYSGELTEEQPLTVGGQVTAIYTAGTEVTPTDIRVFAGAAQAMTTIQKDEFKYSVTLSNPIIDYDARQSSTITVTTTQAPEKPVPLYWNTTKGTISGPAEFSGTSARAVIHAAPEPGEGDVTVSLAGLNKTLTVLHKRQEGSFGVVLEQPTLSAGNSAVVEQLYGGTTSYQLPQSTKATVYGPANSEVMVMAGSFYAPNTKDILHLSMVEIESSDVGGVQKRTVRSIDGKYQAVLNSVDADIDESQSYTMPGASLRLGSGSLSIPSSPELEASNNFFLNIRFRPGAALIGISDEIVLGEKATSSGNAAFSMKLRPEDGRFRLVAEVTTLGGKYQIASANLVAAEQWTLAGIRYSAGTLQLDVNGETQSIIANGPIIAQGVGGGFTFGRGFIGHLDDIKYGDESAGAGKNRVIEFANGETSQRIKLDQNGIGHISIKIASSFNAQFMRVGLSVVEVSDSGTANSSRRDLRIMNDFASRLSGLAVDAAFAESINKVNRHESGVAVVEPSVFAQTIDYLKKNGGQVYDFVVGAGKLLYEVSGLSDAYTIGHAIYLAFNGRWDEVDKMELVFSVVSLSLTVITVALTGGAGAAAIGPLRASLAFLKAMLKEMIMDPVVLLKAGGTLFKHTARIMVDFFSGPGGRAKVMAELKEVQLALGEMLSSTGKKLIQLFMTTVRSVRDLKSFLRLLATSRKLKEIQCPIAMLDADRERRLIARITSPLTLLLGGGVAEAAPPVSALCGSKLIDKLAEAKASIANEEAASRYFDDITQIIDNLVNAKGVLSISESSLLAIKELSVAGHGGAIKNILEAMRDGRLKPHSKGANAIDNMSEAAVISGKVEDFSNFDYLVDLMKSSRDFLMKANPATADKELAAMLKHFNPVGANQLITAFQYKRLVGEMYSLKSIDKLHEGKKLTLVKINDRIADSEFGRNGKEGVDSIFHSADGKFEVFGESKNASKSADSAEFVSRLDNQFVKHLQENFLKRIGPKAKAGDCNWKDGVTPFLQYVMLGSFIKSQADIDNIKGRFQKILADDKSLSPLSRCLGVKGNSVGDLDKVLGIHWDPVFVENFIN